MLYYGSSFLLVLLAVGVMAQPSSLQPDSRRECAICHLEWVDQFNNPETPLLIDKPEKPMVANEETCLGCHDGSVKDSRRRVWIEHGHKTDFFPPPTMNVPKELPLEDGKVVCRTCHTAHSGSEQGDMSKMFFLRGEDNGQSRLCKLCHSDKVRGPELGSHPIGGMPWPIPSSLIKAGSKASPGQRQIYCQVCHTAHGSKQEHLLVMGVSNNQLCLTCHTKLRPGMWRSNREGVHPDRPIIQSQEKMDAIKKMHTRLGPENRLICLSCHKLHEGKSGRFLLAMPLKDSTFCIQCHSEKKGLTSTVHDLRKSAPKADNRLGLTVEQAGPCSSCHMFHNLALRPIPTETDSLGVCSRCHKTGGMAGRLGDMKLTHSVHPKNGPEIACQKCHDPHKNSHPKFLKEASFDLCRSCHAKKTELMGGPHDPATWTSGFGQDNKCFACHKVHSWDEKKKLWTFVPAPGVPPSDGACMGCHKNIHWPTTQPWQVKDVLHPRQNDMMCKSCHDPHVGQGAVDLLRGSTPAHPATVCLECHKDTSFINQSMHSPRAMSLEGHDKTTVCGPCHAVHAVEGSRREKLWAVGSGADTKDRCLGCHGPGGTARMKPIIVRHPVEPVKSLHMAPITCLTCHLPHGKKTDLPDNVSLTILSASKPMLRSGVAETICAICHKMEASTRFLYFHFPEKRKR